MESDLLPLRAPQGAGSLRRWFTTVAVLLLTAAISAALLLVTSTRQLADDARRLTDRIERAQKATSVARALSKHRRLELLYAVTHEKTYLDDIRQAEDAAGTALRGLPQEPRGSRVSTDSIRRAVAAYFSVAREQEQQLSAETLKQRAVEEAYENARGSIYAWEGAELESVEEVRASAVTLQRVSAVLVLLALSVSLAFLRSLRRRLVAPVEAIVSAMKNPRRAEDAYRRLPAMPREFSEIATALQRMAETIHRQNAMQLTFISGVAHDLRNPITAMQVRLDLAERQRRSTGEKPGAMEESLRSQLNHVIRMLDDLSEASRIEAGQLKILPDDTDVVSVVREVVELFQGLSDRHEVTLTAPERAVCHIDRTRISQVLVNLVSNAVKYSPRGGPVQVTVATQPTQCSVVVVDKGLGIAPEHLKRLFEPFHRGQADRLRIPGTGLGLSVAKKIVEAHGGRMVVESEAGRGSSFGIILPLSATEEMSHRSPAKRSEIINMNEQDRPSPP
jgi:signal transduction histidine kinase